MNSSHPIFSKPVWRHFLHIDGVYTLPLPALVAADEMLDAIRRTGTIDPTSSDYAMWAKGAAEQDPGGWLDRLGIAAALILPSEKRKIAEAKEILATFQPLREEKTKASVASVDVKHWDPCGRPSRQIRGPMIRYVSVYPWELPRLWQMALRRAAQGLPGKKNTAAPSRDILQRMREKLCQLAWSAREAGLAQNMTEQVVRQYLADLETRLRARPHGIRWATMRATVEELYRFARYTGTLPEEDMKYLSRRLSRYECLEKGQDALKFSALLETGNTTLAVLEKADELLEKAALTEHPGKRHRLRGAAAILGIFSIVPLRNRDADLIFGETLLWESETWIIDTTIQKTMAHHPQRLVVPLEPAFSRYIDAVILADFDPKHLPELRAQAVRARHRLITNPDGSRPSSTYIPRMFKKWTGNSLTATRTMLHTDQAITRGEAGTKDAMAMCHQHSPETAKKYQEKRLRAVAIKRVQHESAARRESLLPPHLLAALQQLDTDEEEQE